MICRSCAPLRPVFSLNFHDSAPHKPAPQQLRVHELAKDVEFKQRAVVAFVVVGFEGGVQVLSLFGPVIDLEDANLVLRLSWRNSFPSPGRRLGCGWRRHQLEHWLRHHFCSFGGRCCSARCRFGSCLQKRSSGAHLADSRCIFGTVSWLGVRRSPADGFAGSPGRHLDCCTCCLAGIHTCVTYPLCPVSSGEVSFSSDHMQ